MGGALTPRDPSPEVPYRRILLVGFMGCGKSTVGPILAEALGWRFRDFDAEVEAKEGRSIPEIFRLEGEEAFREAEDRAARRLLGLERVVLAAGGGWPCRPGRLEDLDEGTLSVWLRISAPAALERARADEVVRPLLQGPDPLHRAQELLDRRLPYYRMAHWSVETEARSPREVAEVMMERLRTDPERPLRQ